MILSGQVRSEPIFGWHCVHDRDSSTCVERVNKSRLVHFTRLDYRMVGVTDSVGFPCLELTTNPGVGGYRDFWLPPPVVASQ